MIPANSHVIRYASPDDAMDLRRLAAQAGHKPLSRPVLVGEVSGRPAAAVSLVDLRVVGGDERLTTLLVMRARATRAHHAMPNVRERVKALLPWGREGWAEELDRAA
jgi:hypothetical protein